MSKKNKLRYIILGLCLSLSIVLVGILINNKYFNKSSDEDSARSAAQATPRPDDNSIIAPPAEPITSDDSGMYTYLQGPKSWKKRLEWSGKWSKTLYDGSYFGVFGCGFCCMANIYCTHTPYFANPVHFYKLSKKITYYPGGCAISWEQMAKVMGYAGFEVKLIKNVSSYEKFKEILSTSIASVALISSEYDDGYWENTSGHYITILSYDAGTNKVYIGDSGNPGHNRSRISPKIIYKALKKSSDYEIMVMKAYDEGRDKYKNNSLGENWVMPDYLKVTQG